MGKTITYIAESKRYSVDVPLYDDAECTKPIYMLDHYGQPRFNQSGRKVILSTMVKASPDLLPFDKEKGYRCVFNLRDDEQCMRQYRVRYKALKKALDDGVADGGNPIWSVEHIKKKDNPAEYEANQKLNKIKSDLVEKDNALADMKKQIEALKKKK